MLRNAEVSHSCKFLAKNEEVENNMESMIQDLLFWDEGSGIRIKKIWRIRREVPERRLQGDMEPDEESHEGSFPDSPYKKCCMRCPTAL